MSEKKKKLGSDNKPVKLQMVKVTKRAATKGEKVTRQPTGIKVVGETLPLTPEARAQAHADLVVATVTGLWQLSKWLYGRFADNLATRVANKLEKTKKW